MIKKTRELKFDKVEQRTEILSKYHDSEILCNILPIHKRTKCQNEERIVLTKIKNK